MYNCTIRTICTIYICLTTYVKKLDLKRAGTEFCKELGEFENYFAK